MSQSLTDSPVDRQNILNNPFAVSEIQKATQLRGVMFEGAPRVLKEQVANFFEVEVRTIERCLEQHIAELSQNGYEVIRGKRLQEFKLALAAQDVTDIRVGNKTSLIGVFDFRAFLNIGMLLAGSHKARLLRQLVLDIAMDVINQRTGGSTRYINQRDEDFVRSWFQSENYREQFTHALRDCVAMGNWKYAVYTDRIYVSIFREKAQEYRSLLKLSRCDRTRDTFYSEVLDLVASFEWGFAEALRVACADKGALLSPQEADLLFRSFESQAHWKPLVDSARVKMASRDLAFRDALHRQLTEYVTPIEAAEFERFLGEKSKELGERLEEARDVFERLKERE